MIKVINFHDVYDANWLEEVLLFLKKKYRLIPVEDLRSYLNGNHSLGKSCHITIDDGDRTFYEVIYPVLKKHGIPATLFVSPEIIAEGKCYWFQEISQFDSSSFKKTIANYLDLDAERIKKYNTIQICKTLKISQIYDLINLYKAQFNHVTRMNQNMTLDQLRAINIDNLISIGAHTLTHPILANEDDAVSEHEIKESLKGLRDILGNDTAYFAYPNGIPDLDFGVREKRLLYTHGCKLAFSTFHCNVNTHTDPLSIPRFYISQGTMDVIRMKLFMGRYWDTLRNLKTKGEKQARSDFKNLISHRLSIS